MNIITLNEAKTHLHIRENDVSQDAMIEKYIAGAQDQIRNFLNVTQVPNNPSTQNAALLIVGDLFKNREAAMEKELKPNKAVENLLIPYRQGWGI